MVARMEESSPAEMENGSAIARYKSWSDIQFVIYPLEAYQDTSFQTLDDDLAVGLIRGNF